MTVRSQVRAAAGWLATGSALAAAGYAVYAARAWWRYGEPAPAPPEQRDDFLDRFMPQFDVVDRHQIEVAAPAAVTLGAAEEMELTSMPVARAIFKARELVLGAAPAGGRRPTGLVAEVLAMGWAVLAEIPGREVVFGAVTRPWEADVTFRALAPDTFAAFNEPGFVKIAWTLRADPIDQSHSVFRTETRAVATDGGARAKFRTYWAFFSPGIVLIRRLSLAPLKRDAERRARLSERDQSLSEG